MASEGSAALREREFCAICMTIPRGFPHEMIPRAFAREASIIGSALSPARANGARCDTLRALRDGSPCGNPLRLESNRDRSLDLLVAAASRHLACAGSAIMAMLPAGALQAGRRRLYGSNPHAARLGDSGMTCWPMPMRRSPRPRAPLPTIARRLPLPTMMRCWSKRHSTSSALRRRRYPQDGSRGREGRGSQRPELTIC